MNLKHLIFSIFLWGIILMGVASGTQACINCHKTVTPGIVAQYESSSMAAAGIGCLNCHGGNSSIDPSVMEHNGFQITPVVSPNYCKKCHPDQVEEFARSKHAWTAFIGPFKPWYGAMKKEGKDPLSQETARENDPYGFTGEQITPLMPASGVLAKADLLDKVQGYKNTLTCMGCHGTIVIVEEGKIVEGWPNNGIGRLNPDGSLGSCTSCHTRHRFDKSEARKPETCGQCHLGPDHPQMEIYEESKHGNVFFSLDSHEFLKESELTPINTISPTCSVCHMSAFNGVSASHDVGERLYWELQPKISVTQWYPSSGVPLGEQKSDDMKAGENRERMKTVCKGCHSPNWVNQFFDDFDEAVNDYNTVFKSADAMLGKIYDEGFADKSNAIDEYPEIMHYYIWHHDGRRWRMGASMGGYDFAHWLGIVDTVMDKYGRMIAWYETQQKIAGMEGKVESIAMEKPVETDRPTESQKGACGPTAILTLAAIPPVFYWIRRRKGN